jgi:hypothetical protein
MTKSTTNLAKVTARLADVAEREWCDLPATSLGRVPVGRGTPGMYGVVESDGTALHRLDLYGFPGDEIYVRDEAMVWGKFIAIGNGHHFYLVDITDWSVRSISLGIYFSSFHALDSGLLVASGNGIICLDTEGQIAWENHGLAIDGVVIHEVADGIIVGDGEHDPPGGWVPFRIRLDDGTTADTRREPPR